MEEINGGILSMVLNAGPVVIFVMIILLIFSILSWAVIIYKYRILRKIDKESQKFLFFFNKSQSTSLLYETSLRYNYTPFAKLYKIVHEEHSRMGKHNNIIDRIQRRLKKTIYTEMNTFESSLPFLATTGSTAPFLGLFGTVWGIMKSFREIGLKGSANFAVVAPGISEALITTAMGLAVAIPAVIAYNHFTTKINRLLYEMEVFSEQVLRIDASSMTKVYPDKKIKQPG